MTNRPKKAVILTEMPVLAAGLGEMLSAEGFELILHSGDPDEAMAHLPLGERLLVIVHGDSEAGVQSIASLSRISPMSIFVLWTKSIALATALEALESGVSAVLSTKLPAEATKASLLQICDGQECQLRITGDALSRGIKAPRLTAREKQLLQLVKTAANNKEIAYELQVREGTVKAYLTKLFRKVGVRSRFELLQWTPESAEERVNTESWSSMPVAALPAARL